MQRSSHLDGILLNFIFCKVKNVRSSQGFPSHNLGEDRGLDFDFWDHIVTTGFSKYRPKHIWTGLVMFWGQVPKNWASWTLKMLAWQGQMMGSHKGLDPFCGNAAMTPSPRHMCKRCQQWAGLQFWTAMQLPATSLQVAASGSGALFLGLYLNCKLSGTGVHGWVFNW